MTSPRPSLTCGACGRTLPSVYWFRAPGVCVECFRDLSEQERRDLEAAHPRPPHEVPEAVTPLPDEITFRIRRANVLTSLAAEALVLTLGVYFSIHYQSLLLGAMFLALAIHSAFFAWSLLRSPQLLERQGDELRVTFRDGECRSWPLAELSFRGKWFEEFGGPSMVELLDGGGTKQAEIWVVFLTNSELLRRLISIDKPR